MIDIVIVCLSVSAFCVSVFALIVVLVFRKFPTKYGDAHWETTHHHYAPKTPHDLCECGHQRSYHIIDHEDFDKTYDNFKGACDMCDCKGFE